MLPPFNLQKWIDENKHLLKPPVGAKLVYEDPNSTFVVMIVGGPNQRSDYHINQTDEFFYQFKGDMVLKIVNTKGEFEDVNIREGDMFLLPGNTPHSPQRYSDTVGLVIEKKRDAQSIDKLRWYCDNCKLVLYEESFNVQDLNLGKELTPIILRFYGEESLRTCKSCNHISQKPPQKE
ncbi:3-hydroxyanthranilate 3,4-dioxygenase [Cavenderia fasciculata]|uniref:3-hydroxyanthranilate 3,4-dioxygenase n=1 Tax=Cavenderia fasciculata TaxID=261658 RepID=F4QBZ3_CACFS|nr:3-hydroxyanthranilate 3,4-dioxygenase [Cavenderia fasciculata]EGG14731.1 3-hydroxyanthranilate 3,4-dioxygenase [Cavenderia fasciculata]|eukprot:XP_004351239.1 3-hydroxyanthranilate 3,4-dioxygenase [Cavenderia fasciculata]